jgi:hypothetical protein
MKGVVKLTLAEYLKADGISQSRLKGMARSPAHFRHTEDEDSPSTRDRILGHIFHTAVLEPHLLEKAYYLRPETYKIRGVGKDETKKWHNGSLYCKEWMEAHKDREILLEKEHVAIIGMRKSVMEHPGARDALAQGVSEQCLFVQDPDTGIGLKCRCDRLSGNTIPDLKSTDDASEEGFARSCAKWGYDVQAAFYLDIANWLGLNKEFFIFIAVEKEPPYAVGVYTVELDDETCVIGRGKYRRWLSLLSHCLEYNEWPAYSPDIIPLRLPPYEIRKPENLNQLLLTA